MSSTAEQLDHCRKVDLIGVAGFVSVVSGATKQVIKAVLQEELTHFGVLPKPGESCSASGPFPMM